MKIELDGKRALVTGGTGAIGSRICATLAGAGAQVIAVCQPSDLANAQTLQQQWQQGGLRITLAAFDASDFADCERSVQALEAEHGSIDILVNCAGITRDAPLRRMTAAQWQQVQRVNLDSVFNVTRQLVEGMSTRGWGRVVNISSVNGQKGQFGQTNYSASKAGVHGFSMALAYEVARKGVTVNTVAPGYVDSPMINAVPAEIRGKILESVPVGRFGTPDDIAGAVTYLCSPQAAYITGTQLSVNGGFYMGA